MKDYFSKSAIIAIVSIAIVASAGTAYAGIVVILPTITLGGNVAHLVQKFLKYYFQKFEYALLFL